MTRQQLIDKIDGVYSTDNEIVDVAIKNITGIQPDTLDDNDPDEGFYASFSTEELGEIYNYINISSSANELLSNLRDCMSILGDMEDEYWGTDNTGYLYRAYDHLNAAYKAIDRFNTIEGQQL